MLSNEISAERLPTHYPLTSTAQQVSTFYSPELVQYLREIGSYKVLSRDESEQLAIRYQQNGDEEAGRELILANLRLVVKIALGYQKYWANNFIDLVQEGNIGLVRAVKKFDPYRGIKFSYYASYWIKAHILKFIVDNWRLVKICTTQAMRKLFFNLNKERNSLEMQGIKVDNELLAKRLKVKPHEIEDAGKRINFSDQSLDAPISQDNKYTLQGIIAADNAAPEELTARQEIQTRVREALSAADSGLNDRERCILQTRLLNDEPATLQEIAQKFKLSRERIRQLEQQLLKKLKVFMLQAMPDLAY
ncbi:MAG TPA: sigma-70 family RNA polymerase sigma factor [Desulfobacterales bacterium]|nr:sigma-70 family RNA polymerase sigma factor [Desulfobacterales bacterium]